MNVLNSAAKRLAASRRAAVERPPKDFNKPYNVVAGVAGSGAMAGLGALIGAHAGVALLGTAVSGAWILAPILGVAGLAFGAFSKGK